MGFFSELKNKNISWKKVAAFVGTVAVGAGLGGPVGAVAAVGGWWAYGAYKTYKQNVRLELNEIQKEKSAKSTKRGITKEPEKDIKLVKARALMKTFGVVPEYTAAMYKDAMSSCIETVNKMTEKETKKQQQTSINDILTRINKERNPRR